MAELYRRVWISYETRLGIWVILNRKESSSHTQRMTETRLALNWVRMQKRRQRKTHTYVCLFGRSNRVSRDTQLCDTRVEVRWPTPIFSLPFLLLHFLCFARLGAIFVDVMPASDWIICMNLYLGRDFANLAKGVVNLIIARTRNIREAPVNYSLCCNKKLEARIFNSIAY